MAGGYRVDLYALERASAGVNGTLDDVERHRLGEIPHSTSVVGHHHLASTLSDFLSRWQRGVDNLAKDGREIAARLAANVNAYVKVEQGLHGQFTGLLTGSGTDPGTR
jgi:hypothetical protein